MRDFDEFKQSIIQPIRIKDLITQGSDFLIKNNILNGRNEVNWYFQHILECDQGTLFHISNTIIDDCSYAQILTFLKERSKKIPFQQIIGKAPFYGRDFLVNCDVLIPRPESEIIISILENKKCEKLLDIGTGSGCLAITAALEEIAELVDMVDNSKKALKVAKKNIDTFKVIKANLYKLDILTEIPQMKYDIVISNPPYISRDEYNNLDYEVKNFEPQQSLTDNRDGYIFYERYANILKSILKKKGIAVFEISHLFSKQKLITIFNQFSSIKFHKDLNGDRRAISIIND